MKTESIVTFVEEVYQAIEEKLVEAYKENYDGVDFVIDMNGLTLRFKRWKGDPPTYEEGFGPHEIASRYDFREIDDEKIKRLIEVTGIES